MKARNIKIRILMSFLAVILVFSLMVALLGYFVIKIDIIDRAQNEVTKNLNAARGFYTAEIDAIGNGIKLISPEQDPQIIKEKLKLDYVLIIKTQQDANLAGEIAAATMERKAAVGGTRIIKKERLLHLDPALAENKSIPVKDTPMAGNTDITRLDDVMTKEYAVPVFNGQGDLQYVICGGRIINLDYALVDRIRKMVFGTSLYRGKPYGTVTIFQNDVRVATNVTDENGNRAVGTRVSKEVYEAVVKNGGTWRDRAFVVTDWYKTAYEPIKNINGQIIGILYVGILEKPFQDMAGRITILFMIIVGGAALLAFILSLLVAFRVSRPLTEVANATRKLSDGGLGYEVNTDTGLAELNKLAESFNLMSAKLKERDNNLRLANEKLITANKNYIDLIGFVAHELKGILASAVMNAYAIRDGYLGMINFKQTRAIDSVARNLDYLTATVKKFLNLGRIEKGEMEVNKTKIDLKRDVFDLSIDSFAPLAVNKNITIKTDIVPGTVIFADSDLMQVVANNLLANAIKYSPQDSQIKITAKQVGQTTEVEVYNDSTPLTEEQIGRLFKKFSRLDNEQTKREKGVGLGLFITHSIIQSHGGKIWVEPRQNGNSFIFTIEGSTESVQTAGCH
ncbi:MAG: cache domain-containing protein [Phycisphaerae bacterium]|jgi:signal transduction histidine kinase